MNAQKPIGCWQLIPDSLRFGDVSAQAERVGTCLKGSGSQLFMRSFGLGLAGGRTMLSDTFEAAFSCTNAASTWHIFPFWCRYGTMSNVSTTLQLSKG